jgi:hypothetical protein
MESEFKRKGTNWKLSFLSPVLPENNLKSHTNVSNSCEAGYEANEDVSMCVSAIYDHTVIDEVDTSRVLVNDEKLAPLTEPKFKSRRIKFMDSDDDEKK